MHDPPRHNTDASPPPTDGGPGRAGENAFSPARSGRRLPRPRAREARRAAREGPAHLCVVVAVLRLPVVLRQLVVGAPLLASGLVARHRSRQSTVHRLPALFEAALRKEGLALKGVTLKSPKKERKENLCFCIRSQGPWRSCRPPVPAPSSPRAARSGGRARPRPSCADSAPAHRVRAVCPRALSPLSAPSRAFARGKARRPAMDVLMASPAEGSAARGEEPEAAACASRDSSTDGQVDGDGETNSGSSSSSTAGVEGPDKPAPDDEMLREEQSLCIEGEPILGVVVGETAGGGEEEDGEPALYRADGADGPADGPAGQGGAQAGTGGEDGGEGLWSSEEEEDVLQLEGIADHDHVAMLPANDQDEDDQDDDGPPALPHLALAAQGASFGEEASSSPNDDDGVDDEGQYDEDNDYEDEDEDVFEDQHAHMEGGSDCEDNLQAAAGEGDREGQRRAWLDKFERLKAFKAEHGHPHVRQDELLGPWVCMQRRYFKLEKLARERQQLLTSIGMLFVALARALACVLSLRLCVFLCVCARVSR